MLSVKRTDVMSLRRVNIIVICFFRKGGEKLKRYNGVSFELGLKLLLLLSVKGDCVLKGYVVER